MYYPESAIIASKNSHRTDVIQQVDKFLFERQGKEFHAGTAADALRIKLSDVQGILNLYKAEKVITERKVWLCPKDREEIDPVRDDVFHCPTCGRNYRENQCERAVLYKARRIEAMDKEPDPEIDQLEVPVFSPPSNNLNATPKTDSFQGDALVAAATVKAAKIGCAGVIVAAVIGGVFLIIVALIDNNRINGIQVSPSPIVTYTDTPTLTLTITVLPSETVDMRSLTVTPIISITVTETPSTNQP